MSDRTIPLSVSPHPIKLTESKQATGMWSLLGKILVFGVRWEKEMPNVQNKIL
jgi:hypothetical protein